MQNFIQKGTVLEVTGPTGGVISGEAFVIGDLACVASVDIPAGSKGSAAVAGVFGLPVHGYGPSANTAIAFGDNIYKDGAELNVDGTNGVLYGKALGVVSSGATTIIPVLLSN